MKTIFPQIAFIYDRRHVASLTKRASVEIRISYDYKQKYISTGILLYSNQWRKGKIINCPDILQISKTLDTILCNIRHIICTMIEEGEINLDNIPQRLKEANKKLTFIEFCKQRATIRKYGKSKDTQKRYSRFMKLFSEWGEIIEFQDVTEKAIISYDQYLASRGMRPYSKWNNYHRFLNSFILDAINEGRIKRNPYRWVNIEKDKDSRSIDKCLTIEELCKIKTSKLPTICLEQVRDIFVFQTYTCMSYSDLKNFDVQNVCTVKGTKVYTGKRQKTNKAFTIPLLLPAWRILEKYNFKLPIISNVKYNLYLKAVMQNAGIDRRVSTHWARHTGATMLLNEGVPLNIVSKICGHSSLRITEQVYAKLLDETVVDAVLSVMP